MDRVGSVSWPYTATQRYRFIFWVTVVTKRLRCPSKSNIPQYLFVDGKGRFLWTGGESRLMGCILFPGPYFGLFDFDGHLSLLVTTVTLHAFGLYYVARILTVPYTYLLSVSKIDQWQLKTHLLSGCHLPIMKGASVFLHFFCIAL